MTNRVQQSLCAALGRMAPAETDGALLSRFACNRDDAAFAEIVRRHGSMVLGVARRTVGRGGDAEDVFQATFLLLAAKCRSISESVPIASWLHGVARRAASNARTAAVRRAARERRAEPPRTELAPDATAALRELQAVLDEELVRVPVVFREAFLLCCVEGLARSEAARLLGCSEGTASSRVARARDLLRSALSRRGIELSALMTAIAVGNSAAAAPASLVVETVRIATLVPAGGINSVSPAVASLMRPAPSKLIVAASAIVVAACALCSVGAVLIAGEDEAPPDSRRAADDAVPRGPGLDGNWTLTLPAGFQYEVRLERLADRFYRLHSHTVFGGLYEHKGDALVIQTPVAGPDPRFRWTLADGSATLTAEALVFGQRYVGAKMRRSEPNFGHAGEKP